MGRKSLCSVLCDIRLPLRVWLSLSCWLPEEMMDVQLSGIFVLWTIFQWIQMHFSLFPVPQSDLIITPLWGCKVSRLQNYTWLKVMIKRNFVCPSIHPSQYIHLSISIYIYLFISISLYPSISDYLSISICLSVISLCVSCSLSLSLFLYHPSLFITTSTSVSMSITSFSLSLFHLAISFFHFHSQAASQIDKK